MHNTHYILFQSLLVLSSSFQPKVFFNQGFLYSVTVTWKEMVITGQYGNKMDPLEHQDDLEPEPGRN